MTYTGGPLNELNGKMGISAPNKSVPIMKLIKAHTPKSKDELVALIDYHDKYDCKCGIKSHGTIEDFGKRLFDAQIKYWGKQKFSLIRCIQWQYDLFVVQSLKGGLMEGRAIKALFILLTNYEISEAQGYLDEELRIDLIVKKEYQIIVGIQVKPVSFKNMRPEVISFSKKSNQKWTHPVLYLYYDQNEKFVNLKEVTDQIKKQQNTIPKSP